MKDKLCNTNLTLRDKNGNKQMVWVDSKCNITRSDWDLLFAPGSTTFAKLLSHTEQEELFLSAPVERKEYQDVLKALDFQDTKHRNTEYEFIDDVAYADGRIDPISGSDADCPDYVDGEREYWERHLSERF